MPQGVPLLQQTGRWWLWFLYFNKEVSDDCDSSTSTNRSVVIVILVLQQTGQWWLWFLYFNEQVNGDCDSCTSANGSVMIVIPVLQQTGQWWLWFLYFSKQVSGNCDSSTSTKRSVVIMIPLLQQAGRWWLSSAVLPSSIPTVPKDSSFCKEVSGDCHLSCAPLISTVPRDSSTSAKRLVVIVISLLQQRGQWWLWFLYFSKEVSDNYDPLKKLHERFPIQNATLPLLKKRSFLFLHTHPLLTPPLSWEVP